MVNSPTSGKPRSAAVPAPVIYTADKPTASAILACIAFRMNGATTMGPVCNSCRSVLVVFIGEDLLLSIDARVEGTDDAGAPPPLPRRPPISPAFMGLCGGGMIPQAI